MAENETSGTMQRYGGYALLGVVVVAVVVLVVWLFTSGDGDDPMPARAPAEAPATEEPAAVENAYTLGTVGGEIGLIDDHRAEVGQPAPDFALANARAPDRVVRLSDFRGKPVVLNWFASWCGPCRAEIPDFQAAYLALDGEVVFIGVNLQEEASDATSVLSELGATYPALLDADGAIAAHYRLLGMPQTFFIDADGIIRAGGAGIIVKEVLVQELAKIGVTYEPAE